jgi:hypothetical protein
MVKYKIVMGFSIQEIEQKTNEMISYGWKPQGGIGVTSNSYGSGISYFQAMTHDGIEKE